MQEGITGVLPKTAPKKEKEVRSNQRLENVYIRPLFSSTASIRAMHVTVYPDVAECSVCVCVFAMSVQSHHQ